MCNEGFHGKFCEKEANSVDIRNGHITSGGIAGITFAWLIGTFAVFAIGYFIATFIGE